MVFSLSIYFKAFGSVWEVSIVVYKIDYFPSMTFSNEIILFNPSLILNISLKLFSTLNRIEFTKKFLLASWK